ncbi:MAG: selenocysteine-specific translation elongation factor [Syntrophorhabdaceae bacterium]|nr:selenocysteine-specific translation elongation factor [Syntrophorhabdaceae bacterium]
MKKIVIGTAGHIDHGKTTLIKALTGIDCDRLKEEKDRGITTELGFAHYRFGDELEVGIVDVPGHEKFVRHMVAGAWGIDMVLLVVAADEGVMPQTKEHVDICELLGLSRGIVVITKKDLVDEEMLELVREDIKDLLKGRTLDGSVLIPVSSTTGENLELLKETIMKMASEINERSKEGIFRLPVDRVFTIKGMGTIVTGTCISGSINLGEEIEVYPVGKKAKIRNIQAYHEDRERAVAGERVALNLQGIDKNEIDRGVIIGRPKTLTTTNRIDVTLKYLNLPLKPIKTDSTLRFHIATTQEEARLVILNKDTIEPGEELFAQFVFQNPIVALPGDRFILRGPYSIQTIGGGTILDVIPRKHKRRETGLNVTYNLLLKGSYEDKGEYHIRKWAYKGIERHMLPLHMGMDASFTEHIIDALLKKNRIKSIVKNLVHIDFFSDYKRLVKEILEDFHKKYPLKLGISKEELRTRLPSVDIQIFQAAIEECTEEGSIEIEKDKVRLKGRSEEIEKESETLGMKILDILKNNGLTPPSLKDIASMIGIGEDRLKDMMERLIYTGKVVKVKGDLYYSKETIDWVKEKIIEYLKEKKEMAPTDLKSVFDISRKYLIPILEYLDDAKITIRVGDKRILRG